jgi:tyrosyl-tRNA synthetase
MNATEIETTFKSARSITLPMEVGMTVIELAMKANCFKNIEDAATKIQAGGFRINHTLITNPQEVLIHGQHILLNNISVIKVGKGN